MDTIRAISPTSFVSVLTLPNEYLLQSNTLETNVNGVNIIYIYNIVICTYALIFTFVCPISKYNKLVADIHIMKCDVNAIY